MKIATCLDWPRLVGDVDSEILMLIAKLQFLITNLETKVLTAKQ